MISVLTSVTGGKDKLSEQQTKGEAQWIAYMEEPYTSMWEMKAAYNKCKDPRRNSRAPKLLSHLFCDSEYSIWIDGNMSLLKPPEELVERYLKNHDLAVFKHPKRDCIYEEAIRVAKSELDDAETIIEQVSRYEKSGYAKHKGLYECGFLLRRHTPKVIEFNNFWWSEYSRGCVRDQISFAYSVDAVGLRINGIEAPWYLSTVGTSAYRDDFIQIEPHIIRNPNVTWGKS